MSDQTPNSDNAVTSLTAKAGDKVDNYTIMEQVGAGGTAIVFRGHDHVLNRNVAIKQLVVPRDDAGDDLRQRTLAEAEMHKRAAATDPKLLVQYIDTVNDPRGLFLISEYVDGPSLEWIIQQDTRPMEQRQALGIIAATAKALDALHNAGVVHRDLKPSNILMPREGGLKLADFGLASVIAEQQTMDLGSVRYMAPEVLQGQPATPKSDLYSLGMVAYEMLAGRDNFNEAFRTILRDQRNQSMRWVKWHTNARAKVATLDQLVDGMPTSLAQLVARMMEKEPSRRVGSAAELFDAIRNHFAQSGQDQTAPGPHAAMAPTKIDDVSQTAAIPQKSKLPVILAATLAVWVLAIGGFFLWKNQEEKKAQAQDVAALISDIKDADNLIRDQDYKQASIAFAEIRTNHANMFDPDNERGRDFIIEAGRLKAEALMAAADQVEDEPKDKDFIQALEKAKSYKNQIDRIATKADFMYELSLSPGDAQGLVEQYETRANFQKTLANIQQMLDSRLLDDAIAKILQTEKFSGETLPEEDKVKLAGLRQQYKWLLDDERILALLEETDDLVKDKDLTKAIKLLQAEKEAVEGEVDPRVGNLLAKLVREKQLAQINERITKAEGKDDVALLKSYKDLYEMQPSDSLATRIKDLQITLWLKEAEDQLADGRPDSAKDTLKKIIDTDPRNPLARGIIKRIEDAEKMVDAERRGDQLVANGSYTQAIVQYQAALEYGIDKTGRIKNKIRDATGRVHLALSKSALEDGNVVKAQAELNKAKDSDADSGTIAQLQGRIDDLNDYTTLFTKGKNLYDTEDFGLAKQAFFKAKEIFDSEAINQHIKDCDFGIWLKQCDNAIERNAWAAAEGALKQAEQIKINEETKARREKIANRVS